MAAVLRNDAKSIIEGLALGANPNLVDGERRSPLVMASMKGMEAAVDALISGGADANPKAGHAPLQIAAEAGHLNRIKRLVAAGAHVNKPFSALVLAARSQHIEAVELLLDLGADTEHCPFGFTALIYAAMCGNVALINLLLDRGASIDACPWDQTALMYAAQECETQAISVLLARGADVFRVAKLGRTVLDIARYNGCPVDCLLELQNYGAVGGKLPWYLRTGE